jgi:hypothetical protein
MDASGSSTASTRVGRISVGGTLHVSQSPAALVISGNYKADAAKGRPKLANKQLTLNVV